MGSVRGCSRMGRVNPRKLCVPNIEVAVALIWNQSCRIQKGAFNMTENLLPCVGCRMPPLRVNQSDVVHNATEESECPLNFSGVVTVAMWNEMNRLWEARLRAAFEAGYAAAYLVAGDARCVEDIFDEWQRRDA